MEKAKVSATKNTDNVIQCLEGKNILIAEDDFYSREMLTYLLNKTKVNIFTACDGEETIKTFLSNKIDLVLLDIRLPVLDGYNVIERLLAENKKSVVIAQTGFLTTSEIKKIREAGFSDYISKPINERTLFDILIKYLG